MNLLEKKELIDKKVAHIAIVGENNMPNLSVAADILVISEDKLIISHNEMINTPKNILKNKNIVLTSFDNNWVGI